ncbi:MAG: M3 family oligoendopeptidase [Anaerolineaceae bacterium]
MTSTPPRWNLTNIYTDLSDPQLQADLESIKASIATLEIYFLLELQPLAENPIEPEEFAAKLTCYVDQLNQILLKSSTIDSYLYGLVTTNSFDKAAEQLMSKVQIDKLPLDNLLVRVRKWFGSVREQLPVALEFDGSAKEHRFYLLEEVDRSRYMMSEPEEILANELTLSGGDAWSNLQGTLTSQKTVQFELDGKLQTLPMPALINLRSHPDADVRERAYKLEMATWEEMKEPLAACLNGVKGEANTLNKKRGREDCLHSSLEFARIDRETLNAMLDAINESLPMFRRYFQTKARFLGQEKLPWWSLFAPLGKTDTTFSFDQARDLILENLSQFSPELSGFAKTAFDHNWIDAEQRPGKRGGAYCMGIDALKESRILANFDGSLDQVMTLAHELGHGFHNYCAFQADKTQLQSRTPMTLAETASIMNETILFHALLKSVTNREEELSLLETKISGDAQVVVDILSRFYFEKEIFTRRDKSTLSADEISEVMLQAQRDTYGVGLDPEVMNKFAWTWKPHYYSPALSFYNYPYTFGLLFGTGLYAIYQQRGSTFVADYKALLASTGEAPAAELAGRFGIDIRDKAFWKSSLDQTANLVARYASL